MKRKLNWKGRFIVLMNIVIFFVVVHVLWDIGYSNIDSNKYNKTWNALIFCVSVMLFGLYVPIVAKLLGDDRFRRIEEGKK